MAIINLTYANDALVGTKIITWGPLANTDTGLPLNVTNMADKTVHIFGTFGSGGSVTLQGSNDPRVITDPNNANWQTLTDPQGNAITKTSASLELLLENPRYIRPNVTAGDGTTAITVIVSAKGRP